MVCLYSCTREKAHLVQVYDKVVSFYLPEDVVYKNEWSVIGMDFCKFQNYDSSIVIMLNLSDSTNEQKNLSVDYHIDMMQFGNPDFHVLKKAVTERNNHDFLELLYDAPYLKGSGRILGQRNAFNTSKGAVTMDIMCFLRKPGDEDRYLKVINMINRDIIIN
jgi:hypothetical protein